MKFEHSICLAREQDYDQTQTIPDMEKGYFGPGELPQFDRDFFEIPHGTREDWLFERFKQRLAQDGAPSPDELTGFVEDVKTVLHKGPSTRGDE